jgi:hypothetical protein
MVIVEVVNRAIVYRRNKSPLRRSKIERLNEAVRKLGFKIPELLEIGAKPLLRRVARNLDLVGESKQRENAYVPPRHIDLEPA